MSLFTNKPSSTPTLNPYDDALKSIHNSGTWAIVLGILNIIISPLFEELTYSSSSSGGYSRVVAVLAALVIGLIVGTLFIVLGISLRLAKKSTIRMARKRLIYLVILLIVVIIVGFVSGSHSVGLINLLAIFEISQARIKIKKLGPAIESQAVRSKKFVVVASLVAILAIAVILGGVRVVLRQKYDIWVIDGPAMDPTYTNSEKVLSTKTYPTPKVNDVVVFHSSATGTVLIKRIVAIGGDEVVIANGDVNVYSGSSVVYRSSRPSTSGSVNLSVPENDVYVLGDNRSNSEDSRYFGVVPDSDIIGRVVGKI